jgi:thioredoxin-like negative regulator of GroEL
MGTHVKRVRRKRHYPRRATASKGRVVVFLAALTVGFALGFLFLSYVPRAYRTWRETRILRQATELLEQQRFDEATAAAHQILRLRPDSLAAFRVLADASERQNLPDTVAWRAQIARLQPGNLDAQLNLASAALRFGQIDVARRALDNVAPSDRQKAAYHVVAGWLARAEGNDREVEEHFAAALRQEPTNELYQFNLAILRIRSSDPEQYDQARATLETLRKVAAFRAGALRALLSDAVQRDDLERADGLAQELQLTHQITFADYLLCLDFYRKLDEKKFQAVLEKIKPVALRDRRDLGALIDWMNRNGFAAEVLKWTEKLPPELTGAPPPAIGIAEALVEVKNWSRLKRWTRSGSWGDAEYLRLAYQAFSSRFLKQSGADAEFDSLWRAAERNAADRPEAELALARMASRWGLPAEAERLWQRVAKHPPMRREALDALYRIYRANNDLRRLLAIAKQLHESSPREPGLLANYARLALLIEPNTEDAQRHAREAYAAAPQDVNVALTHAFALYGSGRTSMGLDVLRTLPRETLLEPRAAVYTALLLADDNQLDAAREFIAAAKEGTLFPEEKKLLDEAIAKVAAAAAPPPVATPTPAPVATPAPAPPSPAPLQPQNAAAQPAPSPTPPPPEAPPPAPAPPR